MNYSITETANGRLEFEKVPLALDKDAPVIQNCNPRSIYTKLKEKLGEQIARKRKEELVKKTQETIDLNKGIIHAFSNI